MKKRCLLRLLAAEGSPEPPPHAPARRHARAPLPRCTCAGKWWCAYCLYLLTKARPRKEAA
jgi:hypothetical protein